MNQLISHNSNLRSFFSSMGEGYDTAELKAIVNLDEMDSVIRGALSIKDMRQIGSFFTGDELASDLSTFSTPITKYSAILDPACGAGNLLIACSRLLPSHKSLTKTLTQWGRILNGFDLHESFVEATKLRVILEAVNRGAIADCSIDDALQLLPGIEVFDAMSATKEKIKHVTHVVMNPPFSIWDSPNRDFWKKGKVNAAAVIFEHYMKILPKGCECNSILPEVLRSGSRYNHWRYFIEKNIIGKIKIIGRFNTKTDVDVFTIHGHIANKNKNLNWQIESKPGSKISDYFDVSVGRLVAYRDIEEGVLRPYVHSKNVQPWQTILQPTEKRRFKGTVIKPPFVVIRRTSSPTDRHRAVGAIISGKEAVAVENHLIIIKPKDNTIRSCKKMLEVLQSNETNDFLNIRMRCRHLTVSAVQQIPFKK